MSTATQSQKLIPIPDAENVKGYRPGGYHPVHLNDTFKDGRYQVVHKLGYGAYATVWLVYDTILRRYSSLKIFAAQVSESHREVAIFQHLQQHDTGIGKEYVVDVFDFFQHSGPNGVHQCIVMEVLGPCIPTDASLFTTSGGPLFAASDASLFAASGGPLFAASDASLFAASGGPLFTASDGPLFAAPGGPLFTAFDTSSIISVTSSTLSSPSSILPGTSVFSCPISILSGPSSIFSGSSSTGICLPIHRGEVYSLDVAKRMSTQIARGLAYIHKAGIVHGDLHIGNILLHSPAIASWSSKSDVDKYLGVPSKAPLRLWEFEELAPPSPHTPSYIVRVPDPRKLIKLCMSKSDPAQVHVKICDFSEAFIPTIHLNPPPRNTPVVYASPELIFRDSTGAPADIWAFAVLLHHIISRDFLFPSYSGIREQVIRAMVLKLGKLPDKWWYKFEERGECFNEDGKWIGNSSKMYPGFDQLIRANKDMSKAEFSAYERLIKRMVTYDSEERASIDEVIGWMYQNKWVC